MTTFKKAQINQDFNHEAKVREIFAELGFYDLKINTSCANGLSHYVTVNDFEVINEGRLYQEMFVMNGTTFIQVRISDHTSNLDTICNGVDGNRLNLAAFKNLINTGAIAPINSVKN